MDIITGNSSHPSPVRFSSLLVLLCSCTGDGAFPRRTRKDGEQQIRCETFPFSRVRTWMEVQPQRKPSISPHCLPEGIVEGNVEQRTLMNVPAGRGGASSKTLVHSGTVAHYSLSSPHNLQRVAKIFHTHNLPQHGHLSEQQEHNYISYFMYN